MILEIKRALGNNLPPSPRITTRISSDFGTTLLITMILVYGNTKSSKDFGFGRDTDKKKNGGVKNKEGKMKQENIKKIIRK